jgi:L-threonine kinase
MMTDPSPSNRVLATGRPSEGRGVAPGTCGEFAQGPLPDGEQFHVTCPINKNTTVVVEICPASKYKLTGLHPHQGKLAMVIGYTCAHLGLDGIDIHARSWSDLDIGKGMGSSTADVLAGIRAVADAVGETLSAEQEGHLATKVESSDGTMYPGIAAVNHETGVAIRQWDWYPEFVIVMLVPKNTVLTGSTEFGGKEKLASEYAEVLADFDKAIDDRSIEDFAATSTRAVDLNAAYLPNRYAYRLNSRLSDLGALGLNIGHTGTVCGLLFPNTTEGRRLAGDACFEVEKWYPELKEVLIVKTPGWPPTSSAGTKLPRSGD